MSRTDILPPAALFDMADLALAHIEHLEHGTPHTVGDDWTPDRVRDVLGVTLGMYVAAVESRCDPREWFQACRTVAAETMHDAIFGGAQ